MDLKQGDIVWVYVHDEHGRNPKGRPVVILTSTDEIDTNTVLTGCAVTSYFGTPLPSHAVSLPWYSRGHPVTGLRKPSIAHCNWLVTFGISDVENKKGRVPTKTIYDIMRIVSGA